VSKHPMQPIALDERGVARFKENAIIQWLFETGKLNLNEIALMRFDDEDRMQLAQLLGYSVSGFGDLSYADPEVVAAADKIVEEMINEDN
jgi:hypothetical protein